MSVAKQDHIERYRKKKVLEGFREFISRGSMIDMAVGVVMGSAVTSVVSSIVKNLISPLISMLFGKTDMTSLLSFTVNGATVSFGAILASLINFLLVAAAVYFCIIIPLNKFYELGSKVSLTKVMRKTPFLSKLMPKGKKSSSDAKNTDNTDELDEEEEKEDDDDDESDSTSSSVRAYQRREIELLEKINSQLEQMSSTNSDGNAGTVSGTDSQRN
jgi:large conductance mechanosensitive channel